MKNEEKRDHFYSILFKNCKQREIRLLWFLWSDKSWLNIIMKGDNFTDKLDTM